MRKTFISMTMAAFLCVSTLSGCQKMPEASDNQDFPHAQGALEQQVADIAGENAGQTPQQSGGFYEGTIGTMDNKIHISAQIPAIPANVYQITLVPNEGLDKGALRAFLDSPGGNIEDTSQELLDGIEKSDYDNTHGDVERMYYSNFGDHSALRLTDGEKEASFTNHTSVGYVDPKLRDTYYENIYTSTKDDATTTIIPVGQPDTGTGFPVKEAEQILLDRLETLGITEIVLNRIIFIEGNGYSYYELDFVPSYEEISVISEVGWQAFGEIYPNGSAIVTPEGVAYLNLRNFCGKAASRKPVTVLSFDQVEKILEQYLDSNMIQADERITLNNIKLEYYPVPNLSPTEGEIEYRSELELIPVWHIYMPLDDFIDMDYQGDGPDEVLHNIWINAVTGEIEGVR